MKTIFFTVIVTAIVTTIVLITSLKQDVAEGLWNAFLYGCVAGFCSVCTWITAKIRMSRIKRIRDDNSIRRGRVLNSNVYTEVWVDEVAAN